ncbi:hypothetical protein N7478_008600 [Penicillium angulare]|uniref:uncharacterized protein n=1 Tax=Penicillium angulare TaxID=116970 RepID=UPI002540BC7C|nr:uncharacterized protein N7478_008600 [Penicillium angulare]KAJ5273475.1 hypothetical protein N7478_008600 [Penicillium angulare]
MDQDNFTFSSAIFYPATGYSAEILGWVMRPFSLEERISYGHPRCTLPTTAPWADTLPPLRGGLWSVLEG